MPFQFASLPLKWLLLCKFPCCPPTTPTHQCSTHPSILTWADRQRTFSNCPVNEWTNVTDHLLEVSLGTYIFFNFLTSWSVFPPSGLLKLQEDAAALRLVSVPQPTISGGLTSISYGTLGLFFLFSWKPEDPSCFLDVTPKQSCFMVLVSIFAPGKEQCNTCPISFTGLCEAKMKSWLTESAWYQQTIVQIPTLSLTCLVTLSKRNF